MKITLDKECTKTIYTVDNLHMKEYRIEISQMAESGNITVLVERWHGNKERYVNIGLCRFNVKHMRKAKKYAIDTVNNDMTTRYEKRILKGETK